MKDDTINRQAVIEAAHYALCDFFGLCKDDIKFPITNTDYLAYAINKNFLVRINSLPSAQSDRKVGKWIEPATENVYRCSVCEEYTTLEVPWLFYHFCPNCGAKMEVEA